MEHDWIYSVLQLSPYVLAWVAGMIFALVYWRKCPQPALLMFLACLLELISSIGTCVINRFFPRFAGFDDESFLVMRILWIFNGVLGAAAWGMMIAAVVGWRTQSWLHAAREKYYPRPRRPAPPELPPRDEDAQQIQENP